MPPVLDLIDTTQVPDPILLEAQVDIYANYIQNFLNMLAKMGQVSFLTI